MSGTATIMSEIATIMTENVTFMGDVKHSYPKRKNPRKAREEKIFDTHLFKIMTTQTITETKRAKKSPQIKAREK